jgi:predicted transcriptional regulator
MKELTRAEDQVMQLLWELGKTSVKDIVERMPDPKPAYNTVSTIIRILEKKGFVDHEPMGKGYLYFPIVEKADYTRRYFGNFLSSYFNGSFKEMVSFFAREENLTVRELEELMKEIKSDNSIQENK